MVKNEPRPAKKGTEGLRSSARPPMSNDEPRRGILLQLAAEGLVPVLGGCAGMLAGSPEAGLAGVAVGQALEKAINFFGGRIVERWCAWFKGQPPEARAAA